MILSKVKEAGVVGAGGAGFPTHKKIETRVKTVIVNGAECEPLLQVDQEIMEKQTEELFNGLEAVKETTGASRVVIALKAKYKKAVKKIGSILKKYSDYEMYELEDFYPAGDEQQLIYEITGEIVPEGGIPLMVGAVVINVETVININNALQGIPVTHKYVTVNGAIKKPMTLLVPVGTAIKDMISLCGGTTVKEYGILDGGPMMGVMVSPEDTIKKTTKGILILPAEHPLITGREMSVRPLIRRAMSVCCQCRACTDVCPRYLLGHSLEPHKIMRAIAYGLDSDFNTITKAVLCCECGVCDTWGCSMGLSPRNINLLIKNELNKRNYKNTHRNTPENVHPMREYRKIPVKRLIKRLGLESYDKSAPLTEVNFSPEKIELPLQQHIGIPAVPVVNVGEKVHAGQLVAKIPDGSLGAALHTGISGTVKAVGESIIIVR